MSIRILQTPSPLTQSNPNPGHLIRPYLTLRYPTLRYLTPCHPIPH